MSRSETTRCGVCKQAIRCNYGHGQEIRLRHLPILGQETYIAVRPRRAQCPTCQHNPTTTQRFHVAKNYRADFDTLRKQELRRLRRQLPEATYKEVAHGMHWVLRHNHANLDEGVKLTESHTWQ